MGPYELILHTLNWLAPAGSVAWACALAARWLLRAGLPRAGWGLATQILVNTGLGSLVLLVGLALFGVDGKMATYGALLMVCASAQWLMCGGWRRAPS